MDVKTCSDDVILPKFDSNVNVVHDKVLFWEISGAVVYVLEIKQSSKNIHPGVHRQLDNQGMNQFLVSLFRSSNQEVSFLK